MEFHPSDLETSLGESVVEGLVFCAIELEEGEKGIGNHWTVFLNTAGEALNACIDILKRDGTRNAVIRVKAVLYEQSWSSVYLERIAPRERLTVKTVLDLIREKGFDNYLMTSTGAGCRYWVSCLVTELERQGMIVEKDEDIRDLLRSIRKSYDNDGIPGPEDVPPAQGTFVQ